MNEPWPTLATMLEDRTPLVVFWEQSADPAHPWVHDFLTHSWTTNFAEENTEDMNCDSTSWRSRTRGLSHEQLAPGSTRSFGSGQRG